MSAEQSSECFALFSCQTDFDARSTSTHRPPKTFVISLAISDPYQWRVVLSDWEQHIIPTLEELVYSAHTDTELGIYPRALADIHNHIKLRFNDPDIETKRRQIIAELARMGRAIENIPITAEGPHKTDPEEFNYQQQ